MFPKFPIDITRTYPLFPHFMYGILILWPILDLILECSHGILLFGVENLNEVGYSALLSHELY